MHEIGAIDKQTMREFDEVCLTPVRPLEPEEIKELRIPAQGIRPHSPCRSVPSEAKCDV
jgi:hypothetical protein